MCDFCALGDCEGVMGGLLVVSKRLLGCSGCLLMFLVIVKVF